VATRVLTVDPRWPSGEILEVATASLRGGGLVAFPTETFYGLGVAMGREDALATLYRVKDRSEAKPILVLVSSVAMVEMIAEIPPTAVDLMARHWPGALTLVLRARPGVSAIITAGTGTVGVRHSAHRVASMLVEHLGMPVTAPSANRSGEPPPTTAGEVLTAFDNRIDMVLDGGATAGGLPSTVLDLTVSPPFVRRRGAVAL
jgi:L-threonylcarbamoyladenylate synthase